MLAGHAGPDLQFMIENCKLESHSGPIECWGNHCVKPPTKGCQVRRQQMDRVRKRASGRGPARTWEMSWKGTVQESWGKGLRGLDCPVLLGGMSKDGVKPLGLAAERPWRQQRRVCLLPWALQLCHGVSRRRSWRLGRQSVSEGFTSNF